MAAGESSSLAAVSTIPTAGQQQPVHPSANRSRYGSLPPRISQEACDCTNSELEGKTVRPSNIFNRALCSHSGIGCMDLSISLYPHQNKHILLSVWITVCAQVIKSTVVQAKELSDIKQTISGTWRLSDAGNVVWGTEIPISCGFFLLLDNVAFYGHATLREFTQMCAMALCLPSCGTCCSQSCLLMLRDG